ncbi:hypothetical protein ALC53_10831 [Atta colombica]|uniref:Uncharacterized protein n=1 Tax=Atta colombica TaxID=520822 RepID=A0A195B3B8_9HYME|nr:hypothetical protein ALC53_10831 [Atta colombica]
MVLHTASASQIAVPRMSLPAEEDIMVIKGFKFLQGLIKGPAIVRTSVCPYGVFYYGGLLAGSDNQTLTTVTKFSRIEASRKVCYCAAEYFEKQLQQKCARCRYRAASRASQIADKATAQVSTRSILSIPQSCILGYPSKGQYLSGYLRHILMSGQSHDRRTA